MKKLNTVKEVMYNFVGDDEIRPSFHNPFEYKSYVCATDAYAIILTDKSNIDFEFVNNNKAPNLQSIIPIENANEIIKIESKVFEELFTDTAMGYFYDECSECDGNGEVEWDYRSYSKYFDCPVCDGDGSIEVKKPTDKKCFVPALVKIKESYFKIELFYRLFQVSEFTNEDIVLTHVPECLGKGHMFKVGGFNIILMPNMATDLEDFKIIKIEVL